MDQQEIDQYYLRRAIELARHGMTGNEGGPFGAVVVLNNEIIGEGNNQVTTTNDPTAHAEMVAIRNACQKLQTFQLEGATIYSSCEPCPMCLGAIYWARPARLVFASTREDAAAIEFDDAFIYEELTLPLDQRKIPTLNMLRKEGREVFEEWMNKIDRTPY